MVPVREGVFGQAIYWPMVMKAVNVTWAKGGFWGGVAVWKEQMVFTFLPEQVEWTSEHTKTDLWVNCFTSPLFSLYLYLLRISISCCQAASWGPNKIMALTYKTKQYIAQHIITHYFTTTYLQYKIHNIAMQQYYNVRMCRVRVLAYVCACVWVPGCVASQSTLFHKV